MKPTLISSILLVIGLLATVISTTILFAVDSDRRVLEFQKMSISVQTDIQKTLDIYHELIADSAAAIGITSSISRNQFVSFVRATERENSHPAMRAISWIPIVNDESRDQFENRANSEGLDNFQITQRDTNGQLIRSEERALYYPVFYIEPLEGNEPAIGFDLGSNQHRLDALSMSTATESTVATSPIELVQRQGSSLGFLIFSPVYVQNTGVLRGFVSGVFDIDVLVQSSLLSNQSNDIDIALIDESHDPLIPILNGTIHDGIFEERDLARPVSDESVGEIVLPNRVWKLVIGKSDGAFERSTWLWAVPLLGIITSIAIATSILAIERRRQVSTFLLESEYDRAEISRRIVEQELQNRIQKTQLIDSVSHELRTPLTVITARADLLARKLPDATEKQATDLRSIASAAKQLKTMIDSLIEYSNSDIPSSTSHHNIFELNDIVNQVINNFNRQDLDSRLVINIPEPLLGVRCDAVLVKRALIELIENADRYGNDAGQIRLSVTQRDSTTTFKLESAGELIDINSGIELFQPLARGTIFGDASRPGIGLGLAFVRSIAEVHDGSVLFEHSDSGNNVFGFEISEPVL